MRYFDPSLQLRAALISTFTLLGALSLGCSSDSANGGTTLGTGGSSNGGSGTVTGGTGSSATGGSGSGVSTGGGISIPPGGGASGSGGAPGNGMPEVCDGVDNDGNGIVDDVDVGNDGVCDCLQIGTLGQIGPWSNGGNVFASWLNARTPTGAIALDDQVLTEALLQPFQVIVSLHVGTMSVTGNGRTVDAHHEFSEAEAVAFKAWVEKGGGTMTTIGYSYDEAGEVVNINRLLNPLGLGYSTTKLDLNGFVQTWTPGHPVTMGIRSINTDNGVEPADMGTTLATGQGQHLALKVAEVGQGKVVVWGDEWITYDSEWADVTNQQVELLWVNILKWLSPPKVCQVPIPPTIIR